MQCAQGSILLQVTKRDKLALIYDKWVTKKVSLNFKLWLSFMEQFTWE